MGDYNRPPDLAGLVNGLAARVAVLERFSPVRLVVGAVDTTGSGTILMGTGFTIVRNGTGDVSVTFASAYNNRPAVIVGMGATAAFLYVKLHATSPPTAAAFRAAVLTTAAGTATDGIFEFVAAGS